MNAKILRQTYLDNGFVYLPGFFDAREITICQEKIREFIEGLVPQLPRDHVFYEDSEKLSTLKQIQQMQEMINRLKQMILRITILNPNIG